MIQIAVVLILIHAPGGAVIAVNPEQVTSLRMKHESNEAHVTKEANCQINLVDGHYVLAMEDCASIRKMLEGKQ